MDLYALKDFPHRGQLIRRDQRFSVSPVDAAILTNQGFARFAEIGGAWPQIEPEPPAVAPTAPPVAPVKRRRTPKPPGTPRTPRRKAVAVEAE